MRKTSKSVGLLITGLGVVTAAVFALMSLPRYETKASVNDDHSNHKHTQISELNKLARKENALLDQQQADPSVTDEIAYGLALRFISKSNVDAENRVTRLYLDSVMGIKSVGDQDKLMEKGKQYKLASNLIQMQAESITAKYHPTHTTVNSADEKSLKKLSKDREKLAKDTVQELRSILSQEVWQSFNTFVLTRLKSKIKANRH